MYVENNKVVRPVLTNELIFSIFFINKNISVRPF